MTQQPSGLLARIAARKPQPEKQPDNRPEWLRRKEDGYFFRGEWRVGLPAKALS